MNFRRLRTGLVLGAFLAAATAGAGFAQTGTTGASGVNPNAPPPPPVPGATGVGSTPVPGVGAPQAVTVPGTAPAAGPTLAPNAVQSAIVPNTNIPTAAPTATPTPLKRGRRSRPAGPTPSPEPSDTPEPPQFSTLDGIWEIEIQPIGHRLANYQHFSIVQNGSTLTGYWEHDPKRTHTPITGNFDGRLIQIVATTPTGSVSWNGYVESFGDMVGLMRTSATDPGVAFTAQHRKKEKS